ncbi:612_t:CDS:2 [Diversispora eburnea]|uniref:612_t:CDS:1 n=1 Tax=Diversispora eburnea TaxID=1213867 RepID=A0A9N9F606_9GLOM|nr:612_t:CDS:2 [Diversispora eburnea]
MTKIFYTRKLDGSDKNIKCIKCKRRSRINSSHICYYCHGINSLIVVDSGNINIDNFIKGTQSSKNRIGDRFLEWVPYKEFKDVKKIGQGGFSKIFKATWKISDGMSNNGTRSEDEIKEFYPYSCDGWLEFNKAEDKRLEMVEFKKPFVKNPGYEHPNSRYYSTSLNSMIESINSTVSGI